MLACIFALSACMFNKQNENENENVESIPGEISEAPAENGIFWEYADDSVLNSLDAEFDAKKALSDGFYNIPAVSGTTYYISSVNGNDSANGKSLNFGTASNKGIVTLTGYRVNKNYHLNIKGWCAAEGGIKEYVWSADGGLTWNSVDESSQTGLGYDELIKEAAARAGLTGGFADTEASKNNAVFQANGITVDLSAYKNKTIDVIIAAIPQADQQSLILLYCFEDFSCERETILDKNATMKESSVQFAAHVDKAGDVSISSPSVYYESGKSVTNQITVNADNRIDISGWCVANGGVLKYVWSADNGLTWNDCVGTAGDAYQGLLDEAKKRGVDITDEESSKNNSAFQGPGLTIDLSGYAGAEQPLSILFCAVPVAEENSVCLLFQFTNIIMTKNAD